MRSYSSAIATALAGRALKARDFIWLTGLNYSTGSPESLGFWNDVGSISASVNDVTTGTVITRNYTGGGSLLSIDDIPLTNDITVRTVEVTMSQLNSTVTSLVRGYNLKGQPVAIHRGLFNPSKWSLVDPAVSRFVGFVDTCEILDPVVGGDGQITLGLVSHTRELTFTNTDVRSNESQHLRDPNDDQYQYTGVAGSITLFWGEEKQQLKTTTTTAPTGLSGWSSL